MGKEKDLPGVSEHLHGVGREGPGDELADVSRAETHEGHGQGLRERVRTATPGRRELATSQEKSKRFKQQDPV